jgi:hypothetical protein
MSRTDNDIPWKLLQEDRPWLPWARILNTRSKYRRAKQRMLRKFWHGERHCARLALRNGDEAPKRQNPYNVRAGLW